MSGFKILAATFLSGSLLTAGAAQAMDVQVYERMSATDQGNYTVVMISGAKQVLTVAGRADQAAQVERLFTTKAAGDENTLGMVEFELNLAQVDKTDADNLVKNPNAGLLSVELAMIATLKANGIILPKSFMHVGDNFRPKSPLMVAPAVPSRTAVPSASHPTASDDDPIGSGGFITPPKK